MPLGDGIGNDPGNSLGNDPGSGVSQGSAPTGFPSGNPAGVWHTGIDWNLLPDTYTRLRPTYTETSRGNQTINFSTYPTQQFRGTIQSYIPMKGQGILTSEMEGTAQHITHFLYCNRIVNHVPNAASTDILFLDRIVDSNGQTYRVEAAVDDGGRKHHLKVPLRTLSPEGD